jgi:hypothetical protein
MILASAVDSKTGTCFHSVACLMYWSQLAKGTFYQAVEELVTAGILRRERRRKGNRTNLWTLDIKKMESLRVSWDSIRPKDAAPEPQDEPDSEQGIPETAPAKKAAWDYEETTLDDGEEKLTALCQFINKKYGFQLGSDSVWMPNRVIASANKAQADLGKFSKVAEWAMAWAWEGNFPVLFVGWKKKPLGEPFRISLGYIVSNWNPLLGRYEEWEKECAKRLETHEQVVDKL